MLACCLAVSGALGAGTALAEANPAAPTGQYEEALVRFNAGDFEAAIIHLKNTLQADLDDLAARILIARAYLGICLTSAPLGQIEVIA